MLLALCINQVVEHGLGHLPFTEKQITTPTGKFRAILLDADFKINGVLPFYVSQQLTTCRIHIHWSDIC